MMPCVCCHDDTVERQQRNRSGNIRDDDGEQASPSEYENCVLYCNNCGRGHFVPCVIQFIDRIESGISPNIRNHCQWFRSVDSINFRPSKLKYYIERGICCSFKPSFSGTYTVTKPSLLHYVNADVGGGISHEIGVASETGIAVDDTIHSSSSEDEDNVETLTLCHNPGRRRRIQIYNHRHFWRTHREVTHGTLQFLSKYHVGDVFRSRKFHLTKEFQTTKNNLRYNDKDSLQMNNKYSGALYIPSHALLIQTQACNSALYVDIHGLAKSPMDSTPGLPHAVLSDMNSRDISEFMNNHAHPSFKSSVEESILLIENVPSPEDASVTRSWSVQLVIVRQVLPCQNVIQRKGQNTFPPEEIKSTIFFGNNQVHPRVDCTIILGLLNIDGNATPKLILLRFHSIMSSIPTIEDANLLYDTLRCVSGNGGYEMNRVGGSSGVRTEQSDQDLLMVLNDLPSSLPRKCGASLIMPFKYGYKILYTKRSKKKDKHRIAICTYSVPRDGGSFSFNNGSMERFPVLGEFSYMKMLGTMIILRLNEMLKKKILLKLPEGHCITNMPTL